MNTNSSHATDLPPEDINIVELWLRRDPIRWVAGALAGAFAGLVMLGFAMIFGAAFGYELWFAAKVPALPFLGNSATELGFNLPAILVGVAVHEALCAFLGIVYAHFAATNSLSALLALGAVWGSFSWVFLYNLFFQSFHNVYAAHLPLGGGFLICMVFGFALPSVAFFDRALRGSRT